MGEEHVADTQGGVPELLPAHVLKGFAVQLEENFLLQPVGVDKLLIGRGRDDHGLGDLKSLARQTGQGTSFAARQGHLIRTDFGQGQDQFVSGHDIPSLSGNG